MTEVALQISVGGRTAQSIALRSLLTHTEATNFYFTLHVQKNNRRCSQDSPHGERNLKQNIGENPYDLEVERELLRRRHQ